MSGDVESAEMNERCQDNLAYIKNCLIRHVRKIPEHEIVLLRKEVERLLRKYTLADDITSSDDENLQPQVTVRKYVNPVEAKRPKTTNDDNDVIFVEESISAQSKNASRSSAEGIKIKAEPTTFCIKKEKDACRSVGFSRDSATPSTSYSVKGYGETSGTVKHEFGHQSCNHYCNTEHVTQPVAGMSRQFQPVASQQTEHVTQPVAGMSRQFQPVASQQTHQIYDPNYNGTQQSQYASNVSAQFQPAVTQQSPQQYQPNMNHTGQHNSSQYSNDVIHQNHSHPIHQSAVVPIPTANPNFYQQAGQPLVNGPHYQHAQYVANGIQPTSQQTPHYVGNGSQHINPPPLPLATGTINQTGGNGTPSDTQQGYDNQQATTYYHVGNGTEATAYQAQSSHQYPVSQMAISTQNSHQHSGHHVIASIADPSHAAQQNVTIPYQQRNESNV